MEQLWAPWRMQFIEELRDRGSGCVFCELHRDVEGGDDRSRLVLHRAGKCYVLMNRFPYNNGHLMVVPYAHVRSPEELEPAALTEMMLLLNRGLAALKSAMQPEGFNTGMNLGRVAGAGVEDHVHIHVVPRWLGDTNFMPVVGDMRVVPQTWLQTYDQLKAALEALG